MLTSQSIYSFEVLAKCRWLYVSSACIVECHRSRDMTVDIHGDMKMGKSTCPSSMSVGAYHPRLVFHSVPPSGWSFTVCQSVERGNDSVRMCYGPIPPITSPESVDISLDSSYFFLQLLEPYCFVFCALFVLRSC